MDKNPSPPSVFVVDDDVDDFELFSDFILGKHPALIVEHFRDSFEFVELLDIVELPDLLVLDINMPKLSGFDVLRMVKNSNRWKNVPVVFLTTTKDGLHHDKAKSLGAVNLFVKPITIEQWEALVNAIDSRIIHLT